MEDEVTLEVNTDSDYWEMLEATARIVKDWPDWKTGESHSSGIRAESAEQTRTSYSYNFD